MIRMEKWLSLKLRMLMSHAIQIIYIHCTFFTRYVITKVDVDPKICLSPFSHFLLFYLLLLLLGPIWLFFGLFFFTFNPIFKPKFIIFKKLIIAFHFLFNLHYSFQTLRDLIFPILLYLFHSYPIFFLFLIFLLLYS